MTPHTATPPVTPHTATPPVTPHTATPPVIPHTATPPVIPHRNKETQDAVGQFVQSYNLSNGISFFKINRNKIKVMEAYVNVVVIAH